MASGERSHYPPLRQEIAEGASSSSAESLAHRNRYSLNSHENVARTASRGQDGGSGQLVRRAYALEVPPGIVDHHPVDDCFLNPGLH